VPFDIGLGELIGIAVVALIVLGPEKLPRYAADAARMLRTVRKLASDARNEVTKELGPELSSLGDLNPRSLVRKHLLEPVDLDDLGDLGDLGEDNPMRRSQPGGSTGRRPASATGTDGPAATPRYDEDVT
jgi:sec-independent protein translocase protein TatB